MPTTPNKHFVPQVQVVLVSGQPIPNLTPVLDPAFRPEEIVFLVTPDMRHRAKWLEQVLRPRGIKTTQWTIDDAYDFEHLRERIWALLEARGKARGRIALNATGGTKPMSIAAFDVFRDWQAPIFYIHPEQDRVIWLHPSERSAFDLADRVKLEPFLQAHGAMIDGELMRSSIAASRFELAQSLVADLSRFRQELKTLNWLASKAEYSKSQITPRLSDHQYRSSALRDLIDRFDAFGLLSLDNRVIRFPDEDARFFVNGGWLEEYAFALIQQMRSKRPLIQDIGRSVNVRRETRQGEVPNELDVAFLADNRFYLIECKTRQWTSRQDAEDGPGAEALYKLDSLRDLLGGLQARAMLVSYQEMKRWDRERAEALGVKVCAGHDVQQLKSKLSQWIG
jgi:hypothetical protein